MERRLSWDETQGQEGGSGEEGRVTLGALIMSSRPSPSKSLPSKSRTQAEVRRHRGHASAEGGRGYMWDEGESDVRARQGKRGEANEGGRRAEDGREGVYSRDLAPASPVDCRPMTQQFPSAMSLFTRSQRVGTLLAMSIWRKNLMWAAQK